MDGARSLVDWSSSDPNAGIVCRRCETVFPAREGSCPECGTPVRGLLPPAIVIVTGLTVLAFSLFPFDALPVLLGLALCWLGVHVVRDRRERLREAKERRGSAGPGARSAGQR